MESIFKKALGTKNINRKKANNKLWKPQLIANLEQGIELYKKEYGREPYQSLSNLIFKIKSCNSKSSNSNTQAYLSQ